MYGADIERVLGAINKVKDVTVTQIKALAESSAYRIDTENHEHSVTNHTTAVNIKTYEQDHSLSALTYVSPILIVAGELEIDRGKFETIRGSMSNSTEEWNNEYGSPWTEMNVLKDCISTLESFVNSHSDLKWIGEKFALLQLMQTLLSISIDVKNTVIEYQSHIQGGYSNVFNDNEPPIVWDNFSRSTGKSIGNRDQNYNENVNIKKPTEELF